MLRSLHAAILVGSALLAATNAVAQHEGDVAVGRSAANQLKCKPWDALTPCFDPATGVGLLTPLPSAENPTSWRATSPGFDANFSAAPELDFYQLPAGANIRLVAVSELAPAFSVKYNATTIRHAGEYITLGSEALHRHLIFTVDVLDPAFDPLRTLWFGQFVLRDVGAGVADSDPFILRLSIVACVPADVNGDGAAGFGDINPFVAVIVDPEGATAAERCAADVNRDGYVTFADINPFVAALTH
jgi:hypothetical protein